MLLKTFPSILLLILLSLTSAFSQVNYKEGYILTLEGDTLKGSIDYRNWKSNPEYINFKEGISGNESKYTPNDIIEFGVNDEKYVSAFIEIEISSSDVNQLENNQKPNIRKQSAFLQTLVQGDKDLYLFISKTNKTNLYFKINNEYKLLVYKLYRRESNGSYMLAENNLYKNQLASYLSGCSNILNKLRYVKYKQKDVKNLFEQYYQCTSKTPIFIKKKEGIEPQWGILVGSSLTKLNFIHDGSLDYLSKVDYPTSINLTLGGSLNLVLPRNQRKWSIYNSLLFTTYKVEGSYLKQYSSENYATFTTKLEYSYLKFMNALRFTYPLKNAYWFVDAGVTNAFKVKELNYLNIETVLFSTVRIEEGDAVPDARGYEQGFTLSTGLSKGNLVFELRYENANGISKIVSLKSTTHRLYLFLGYTF